MSLIKKPHQIQMQAFIKAMLYGQPGSRKSTLALSAPAPLLLDFDGGVSRIDSHHHVDTVQIQSWQDCLDVLKEDLSSYKTLVIDTAGKMLDFMGLWLIQRNPKLGKANGALTMQGYGERKAEFNAFLKRVAMMGKHLVFVAHEKVEKDGDQIIIRPEIGGSSGSDLIKELDLVGYTQLVGNRNTVSFDPCEKFYGKNTCKLPALIEITETLRIENDTHGNAVSVPIAPNNQLSGIFEKYQKGLESRQEMAADYADLLNVIANTVEGVMDAETANEVSDWARTFEGHIWDSKMQTALRLKERTKELGLTLDGATKKYVAAEPANQKEVANG